MKTMKSFPLNQLSIFLTSACLFGCSEDVTNNGPDDPEPVVLTYETVNISPSGTTALLPNGITVDVPPGAVPTETEISIAKLDSAEMSSVFGNLGTGNVLAGFDAKPDGMTFDLPITITLSDIGLSPGDFVISHAINLDSKTSAPADISFFCNPVADSIAFAIEHFSGHSVEVINEMRRTSCVDTPDDCRCKDFDTVQADKHVVCQNGDCQKTESRLVTTYRECGTEETNYICEYDPRCDPTVSLIAANNLVPKDQDTTLTAEIQLACDALPDQPVDFFLDNNDLASLSAADPTTNSSGRAQVVFEAGDETGVVTNTVNATISYYTMYQTSSAGGVSEKTVGDLKTFTESATELVEITEAETWSGVFTVGPNTVIEPTFGLQSSIEMEINFTVSLYYEGIASEHTGTDNTIINELGDQHVRWFKGLGSGTQSYTMEAIGAEWVLDSFAASTNLDVNYVSFVLDAENVSINSNMGFNHFYFAEDRHSGTLRNALDDTEIDFLGNALCITDGIVFEEEEQTGTIDVSMGILGEPYTLTLTQEN